MTDNISMSEKKQNKNSSRKEKAMTISELLFSSPCKETGFCQNPNCKNVVAEFENTGRWFILFGHAGFNSWANNRMGYSSKEKALAAWKRYSNFSV